MNCMRTHSPPLVLHVHTGEELLRLISNTVSIFYTSLPKTLSNSESSHTFDSSAQGDAFKNSYTGGKTTTTVYLHSSYIGILTVFERHVFIFLGMEMPDELFIINTLKLRFGF
ncbi:hypothetical protein JOB18_007150 [Solea senegalensis]|uniref:Uncharacterized protein n=1 Tax=Solea senegalensis TaxID=28829 RepID=A0AAV6SEX9_SOLSE|nr:hypothetical protein JOB18_007150 [Solea senegalensis]